MILRSGRTKPDKNLTQLLTTAFVSLSLIILFVAGGLQLFFYFQSEKEVLYSKQQLIAEGAKSAVNNFLQKKIQALEATAGLYNPDATLPKEWELALQRLLGLETAFRGLGLFDLHDEPITYVARFSPSQVDHSADVLKSVRHCHSTPLEPFISEVHIDPQTSEPVVYICVPVMNALRELRGYLTAELNLKFIWDLVGQLKVGNTGYVYVADQSGRLIAFDDTSRVLKGEIVSGLPPVDNFQDKTNIQATERSRLYKGLSGTHVMGTAVLLKEASWTIVAEMPWKEAYQVVLRTGVIFMGIVAGMAFLAAVLGAMVARKLTVPLRDLQETAVRIANGDRRLQARTAGPAEVAGLAEAFNSMASQLLKSLQETESQYEQIKVARDALQKSEARLQLALEGTADGIWNWNLETHQFYFSPRWYRILGYEPDELQISTAGWSALIHPEDLETVKSRFNNAILSRAPFAIEFRMMTKNGQWLWVLSRGKVVEAAADGRPIQVAGSLADIAQRKQAESERAELEAKFLQAQKMESIGRLAGGVAHDFNNMLTIILGRAELAMLKLASSAPFYKDFHEIMEVGKRSAALTRQLLGFARKQTIEPRVLDFNKTVEEMLDLLRRLIGEGIEISWKPSPGVWPVKMDPAQVDQLLTNLVINARDAIKDVGHVTIETYNTMLDEAYCSSHPGFSPGDYATLAVSDNGCGMDKKTLDNIFEPFFTTKQLGHGTGLGLATVYGIIKQNNGFINAYSESGKGTSFKIYIPRHHLEGVAMAEVDMLAQRQPGQETILLVEDNESLLEITTAMLKELGYNVLAADGPQAALQLAEVHDAPPHLVMTDVIMPGMNGLELQKYLSILLPGIKCLFMSGYTANVIAHQGILEEGCNFLSKPFSIHDLAVKLRAILDGE